MIISIIAAIGKNNEIGQKNTLLWNLPADMKHFKETTSGHTVIMGQKTFESIGRPLPNRRNIILTKESDYKSNGIEVVNSTEELDNLLKKTSKNNEENFIIGGGQIYKLFMEKTDKLYITHVDASFPEADAFFPIIDMNIWKKIKTEKHPKDEFNKYDLEFVEYIKKVS
jgi:dihydrofolate reductase